MVCVCMVCAYVWCVHYVHGSGWVYVMCMECVWCMSMCIGVGIVHVYCMECVWCNMCVLGVCMVHCSSLVPSPTPSVSSLAVG